MSADTPEATLLNQSQPVGQVASESPSLSDEELLQSIAAGGQGALLALHRRYAPVLYGLGQRMLGVPGLVHQGVEDTFVTVWNNAAFYDPTRATGRGWLISIAHHRFLQLLRERGGGLTLSDWFDRVDAPGNQNLQLLALAYYRGEPLLRLSEISGLNLRAVENSLRAAADQLARDHLGDAAVTELAAPAPFELSFAPADPPEAREEGAAPAFSGVETSTFGFGPQSDLPEWERVDPHSRETQPTEVRLLEAAHDSDSQPSKDQTPKEQP